jgi:hypothetical protein
MRARQRRWQLKVFMKASTALLPASRAEPALKPNQPTHSSEAPTMVSVSECGVNCFLAVAHALADHVGTHEARDRGIDVHHRAAGEVQRAPSARA